MLNTQRDRSWFTESNWVSSFTKWFLTLGGKAARLVLIAATLYMSAELYPGVKLPDGLNLAVFIILSFALDMGGIGLAQISKRSRAQGNITGAKKGEDLSKKLIFIMIAGLVTVSIEPIIKSWGDVFAIVPTIVNIILTIARAVYAVKYGHVLNDLEMDMAPAVASSTPQNNPVALSDRIDQLVASVSQLQNSVSQSSNLPALIQSLKTDFSQALENLSHDTTATMKTLIDDKIAAVALPPAGASEADATEAEEKEESDSDTQATFPESDKKGEKPTLTRESIQEYILSHQDATQREIAEYFGTTTRTIQRKMSPVETRVETRETARTPLKIVK